MTTPEILPNRTKNSDAVLVWTTMPSDPAAADALARTLVERRLAACVAVLPPMTSTYRWQGEIQQASELQLLIKTTADAVSALGEAIRSLHPYDTPELLVTPIVEGSAAYFDWLRESVQ